MNKPRFKRFYKNFILTYHTIQFTWYSGTAFDFSFLLFKKCFFLNKGVFWFILLQQEEIKKSSRPHEAVSSPSTGPRAGLFGIVSDGTLSGFSNSSSNGNSSDVKSSGLFETNKSNSQSGLFGQSNVSPSNSQTVFNSSPTPGSVFGNSNSSNNPGTLFGINNQTSSIIDTSKQSGNLFGVSSTNQAFGSVSPAALASSHGTVSTQASKPQTGNNIGPESQSMPPTTLVSKSNDCHIH